jgi:3-deoxy-manno-octulosonate cytidylyltransferase (CMP-KDO synthetase)
MPSPFTVIIPARLASTRLPRKPLADIGGAPMVIRVAQQAAKSAAQRILIATDSDEILDVCGQYAFECVKTLSTHATGTDRLSEVVSQLGFADDAILVNVQGDEPFIPPELINQVATALANSSDCAIATAAVAIVNPTEIHNPNAVKVVLNQHQQALYFSRAAIPYQRDQGTAPLPLLRHLGIYAYRCHFLKAFAKLPPAPIEQMEALEQLRAIYNGYKIHVELSASEPPAGIDTPEDLEIAQRKWQQSYQK